MSGPRGVSEEELAKQREQAARDAMMADLGIERRDNLSTAVAPDRRQQAPPPSQTAFRAPRRNDTPAGVNAWFGMHNTPEFQQSTQ